MGKRLCTHLGTGIEYLKQHRLTIHHGLVLVPILRLVIVFADVTLCQKTHN